MIRSRYVGVGGHRLGPVAIVLIVALSFAGTTCSLGGTGGREGPTRPALAGGTLRLAVVGGFDPPNPLKDPTLLDPAAPYTPSLTFDAEILRCCLVRTLLSYTGLPTEEGGTELRPDIAAAMPEVSRDWLTWTFRLKEGLRYAPPLDDVEITAGDIVRGIERTARIQGATGGTYSTYYSVIQGYDAFARGEADSIPGLEVVDDHTLAVHLTEVTNDLGYRLALPGSAPIPPNPRDPSALYGVADGHDEGYGPYLIASGPYMIQGADLLEPWKPAAEQPRAGGLTQKSLTLVRDPSWDRSTDHIHGAYIDRIEFRRMPLDDAYRELARGTFDTVYDGLPSAKFIERYEAHPELKPLVRLGPVDNLVGYTPMNLAVPPFDDVHVRKAVNLAYDNDRFIRVANRHWFLQFQPFGHVAPDATEDNLLRDQRTYPFDPAAAREEMARSRYDGNRDGICDDPACKDVFTLETGWQGFEKFVDRVWVEDLEAIGITLDIRRVANQDRYTKLSTDPTARIPLDLGAGWVADYPNASNLFANLFTSEGVRGGFYGANESLVGASADELKRWGYRITEVPNVDAEIEKCLSFIGFAQTRCWAELDELMMTRVVPWVPQITLQYNWMLSERLVRFSFDQVLGWPALDQIVIAPQSD